MQSKAVALVAAAGAFLLGSTSCTAIPSAAKTAAATAAVARPSTAYSSTSFVVPFDITLPAWVRPGPKAEQRNFVTWAGARNTALRVMHPVEVYRPGDGTPSAVPNDFLGYLHGQSSFGVRLSDERRVTAGGHPATIFTMTTPTSQDGSFGCPVTGLDPADCFGAQPDVALRMAVLKVRGTLLLVWLRDAVDAQALKAYSASFTRMITGLRFPTRRVSAERSGPASTAPAPTPTGAVTPLDGTWTVTITRDELANSPLLLDPGEVSSENYGSLRLVFDRGTEAAGHAKDMVPGVFRIHGDVLTIESSVGERFVARWRITGNHLILKRDTKLGNFPTALVLKPWTRVRP
jgi:hypothetical protein